MSEHLDLYFSRLHGILQLCETAPTGGPIARTHASGSSEIHSALAAGRPWEVHSGVSRVPGTPLSCPQSGSHTHLREHLLRPLTS